MVGRVKAFMGRLSSLFWLTAFPPPCGSLGELARGPLELLLLVHQRRGVLGLPPAELLSAWLRDARLISLDSFALDALADMCAPQRHFLARERVVLEPTGVEVVPAALTASSKELELRCSPRSLLASGGFETALCVAAFRVRLLRLVPGRRADAVVLAEWANRFAFLEFGGRAELSRELRVLLLEVQGRENDAIAARLFVTQGGGGLRGRTTQRGECREGRVLLRRFFARVPGGGRRGGARGRGLWCCLAPCAPVGGRWGSRGWCTWCCAAIRGRGVG